MGGDWGYQKVMRFTAETAREMALRSHGPDSARQLRPLQPAIPAIPAEKPAEPDKYHGLRLTRVRVQLNSLDSELEGEMRKQKPDARRIKELVDAQMRLSEQERILSGRPLPGSNRPRSDRPRRSPLAPEPVETPQPVVSSGSQISPPPSTPTLPVQPAQTE